MNFLKRCCESKRECLTYIIVTLWIGIGILGTYYETNFAQLAAYFISLTGFAGGTVGLINLSKCNHVKRLKKEVLIKGNMLNS